MVHDDPTLGLLVFLLAVALPALALTFPLAQHWYMKRLERRRNGD